MNMYVRMFSVAFGFLLFAQQHAVLAHENDLARVGDEVRNHVVAETMPAVYNLEVTGTRVSTDGEKVVNADEDNSGAYNLPVATGTAFGVSSNGLVLTKMHNLNPGFGRMAARITVPNTFHFTNGTVLKMTYLLTTKDGRTFSATIVSGDPNDQDDIALLKINDDGKGTYPYLSIADKLPGYDSVITIGSPLRIAFTVGEGIISNPDALYNGRHLTQTSALMINGSSGGPLIRVRDHMVVGMVDGLHRELSKGSAPLGFTTPVTFLNEFLKKYYESIASAK